jgi:S-ribosylhomocysteine lyase LuxS involved in autoinducer biosynthesis
MIQEITLAEYHKLKHPLGHPTKQTIRNHVRRGIIQGRIVRVGSRDMFYMPLEPTHANPEIADILRSTM